MALKAALLAQQSARLKLPAFGLYIDLRECFPNSRHAVQNFASAWHGLPREVRWWTQKLLRTMRGMVDTKFGISEGYDFIEGLMMGCTLSPDELKFLLNTVACAICICACMARS